MKDAFPNANATADLKILLDSNLRVLDFYESLKSLYLSGGYAARGPFNWPIISNNISQVIWNQMRRVVNQTRQEIKNGDFSMKRMDAQIKLYENQEKLLSELAVEIAKKSEYPKNLAFAIRDLGKFLVDSNLSRTDYGTDSSLRNNISTWLTAQNVSFEDSLTPLLTQIHRTIGPDHFNSLADVLEILPYQVRGIWNQDADALSYYTENIAEQTRDSETGLKLSKAFRDAFLNVTGMEEADKENFLYRMSSYDIDKATSVIAVRAASGAFTSRVMTAQTATDDYTRLSNSKRDLINSVTNRKLQTAKMKDFLVHSADSLEASPSIESLENIRMALIAGARLISHLGSIESALNLSSLVPAARDADRDIPWLRRVEGALEVIKYLNRITADQRVGGQVLLNAFLNEPNIRDQGLFLNSKKSSVADMTDLFEKVKEVDQKVLGEVAGTIRSWTLEMLKTELDNISKDGLLKAIQSKFGGKSVQDDAEAKKVEAFLKSLQLASSPTASRLKALCGYFKTISSQVTNYPTFIQSFIDFIPLSRDGTWQDVWNALYSLSTTVLSDSKSFHKVLAPLIYVAQSKEMSLINLREVFLSLQQLSFGTQQVVEAKVKFVKDFYGNLKLEDVAGILEGFDVNAKDIASKVDSSMFVDDFLDVLESSGSKENFMGLFGFHGKYTTSTDVNESIRLIGEMVVYLHEELAKPTKSAVVRKSFVNNEIPEKVTKKAEKREKNSDVALNGSTVSSVLE